MAGTLQLAGLISLLSDRDYQRACPRQREPTTDGQRTAARAFIVEHEQTVAPKESRAALAWWNANVTGRDQDFQAKELAQNQLDAELSDPQKFARLKELKASSIRDPLLARQIAVLYLLYLEKQVDPELLRQITAKANAIEKTFNAYRASCERPIDHRQ